ncbi:hypothetical protein N9X12_01080 [Alphaproteobacteria bacterium]|nr:hypothetical protein [Alphaproteobacteria bacterium]
MLISLFLYCLTAICIYSRKKQYLVYDYLIVTFVFSGLYVLVPRLLLSADRIPALQIFSPSSIAVSELKDYSDYFIIVLSLSTLIWTFLSKSKKQLTKTILNHQNFYISKNLIYFIYFIILFQFILFLVEAPSLQNLWIDRIKASGFKNWFNSMYKTQFLFILLSFCILSLSLQNNSKKPLFLIIPFVLMDLYTSDRTFIFQFMMLFLVLMYFLNKEIKLRYVLLLSFIFPIISIYRAFLSGWEMSINSLIPGELYNTYVANLIILDSNETIKIFPKLLRIIIPEFIIDNLVSTKYDFKLILAENSPLQYGLGGSILSEPLSSGSTLFKYIYPFILVGYSLLMIFIFKYLPNYFGCSSYMLAYLTTHTLFRGGVINAIDLYVYYIFIISLIIFLDRLIFKFRNEKS